MNTLPQGVPNGPVSSHLSGTSRAFDHSGSTHGTHSLRSFVNSVDTSNPRQSNTVSSKSPDLLTPDDEEHDKLVHEHGEEASDEDVIDGESEIETALLPELIPGFRRLRPPKSDASSSQSSRAGSDEEEQFTRLSPTRSCSTTNSSPSSASRLSSSDDEHASSSASTSATTSTAASDSSSGDSDSENAGSDRKQNALDPGFVFSNGKLSSRKGNKHRYVFFDIHSCFFGGLIFCHRCHPSMHTVLAQ